MWGDGDASTPQSRYRVPDGKRLVVEFLNVYGTVADEQRAFAIITTSVNGNSLDYGFPANPIPTTPQFRTDSYLNQTVRLYADGGTDVVFRGYRMGSFRGEGFLFVNFSGYLVDLPSAR